MMAIVSKGKAIGTAHKKPLASLIRQSWANRDGSGILFYIGKAADVSKSALAAFQNRDMRDLALMDCDSRILLAHIRNSSIGEVAVENSHPFEFRDMEKSYTFMHNGHLATYKSIPLSGSFEPHGKTDSEVAFCYLMNATEHRGNIKMDDRYLTSLHRDMLFLNSHGNLNCVFCDGEFVVAYADKNAAKDMLVAKIDENATLVYTQVNENTRKRIGLYVKENAAGAVADMRLAKKVETSKKMLENWAEQSYMQPFVEGLSSKPVMMEPGEMRVYREGELVCMK